MRKLVRIGFPIICVAVVGGTLIAVKNLKNKADQIAQEKNTVDYSNTIVENNTTPAITTTYVYKNTVNTTSNVTNTSANTTTNNAVNTTNAVANQTTQASNQKNTEVTTEDLSGSSEKEKAVTLVAKEWGEDSSVYFTNEGISNGLYIVAVRDKSNTSVKMFYKVDLKNNTVEIDW